MMKNVFPLHVSTKFTCPGAAGAAVCPIKARIRDFGSCVVRVYAMGFTKYKEGLWRGPEIKTEFTVTECSDCGYNRIAAEVIRELLNPRPRAKLGGRNPDYYDNHTDYDVE